MGQDLAAINKSNDETTTANASGLLAWSSYKHNKITVADLNTAQEFTDFAGAQIRTMRQYDSSSTHVKEIPNTKFLVSLHNCWNKSASMKIFALTPQGKATPVYTFEEVKGITGQGEVAYTPRRSILAALSVAGKVDYHLFKINTSPSHVGEVAKLVQRCPWNTRPSMMGSDNQICSLDFDSTGELMATFDRIGMCLISDVSTHKCSFSLNIGHAPLEDMWNRCRWSTNIGDPFLFVKYDRRLLNVLDVEKKVLTSTHSIQLEDMDFTRVHWIDVCPRNGNLVAAGSNDGSIKIFDQREFKIVKTLNSIHSKWINCVRWNQEGTHLASVAGDSTAKVVDFSTGKIVYANEFPSGSKRFTKIEIVNILTKSLAHYAKSVCFI